MLYATMVYYMSYVNDCTHTYIYTYIYALTNDIYINSSKDTNYIHSYMCINFN